eukprot:1606435-Amphidinium_carterae.2
MEAAPATVQLINDEESSTCLKGMVHQVAVPEVLCEHLHGKHYVHQWPRSDPTMGGKNQDRTQLVQHQPKCASVGTFEKSVCKALVLDEMPPMREGSLRWSSRGAWLWPGRRFGRGCSSQLLIIRPWLGVNWQFANLLSKTFPRCRQILQSRTCPVSADRLTAKSELGSSNACAATLTLSTGAVEHTFHGPARESPEAIRSIDIPQVQLDV